MRALFVNEKQNFERGLDPIKAMDIGYGWRKEAFELIEKLKKEGIKVESHEDPEWNEDSEREVYSIILSDINYYERDWPHDRIPKEIVYVHKSPNEIAEEGFFIFDKKSSILSKGGALSIDRVIDFLK